VVLYLPVHTRWAPGETNCEVHDHVTDSHRDQTKYMAKLAGLIFEILTL